MSKFLLDSGTIIWHLRGREKVTEMLKDLQRVGVPTCSALSVLEVQVGVKKGEEAKTDQFFKSLKILDVNWGIANKAAHLISEYRIKGITVDIPDAVIAGTCILHDLVLVTFNTKHYPFEGIEFYPTQ